MRLFAVGDISFGRDVQPVAHDSSADALFANVREFLRSADIVFGNLESPLSVRGTFVEREPRKLLDGSYNYTIPLRGPPQAAEALSRAGFGVVSIANNHTMDYGQDGLVDTITNLRRAGILAVGGGANIASAEKPVIIKVDGTNVAFLAFTVSGGEATRSRAGVAIARADKMAKAVSSIRRVADVVVLSVHWGADGACYPYPWQRTLARAAAEAGASVIIGHHPHVLQGQEFIEDCLVVYSLGNFVFDVVDGARGESAILDCTFTKRGVEYFEMVPVAIPSDFRPEFAEGELRERISNRISDISEPFLNPAHPVWQEIEQQERIANASNALQSIVYGWRSNLTRWHRMRPRHIWALWHAILLLLRHRQP